jgi:Ni2+-binding GTPase involved in maturation of urease and hydrogenase
MKLHLVGGFLGSGKTTAIIHAARALMDQGVQVGVITNDQGKYLVDTAFFRLADLPAVEVSGGCFCCNYDDLDARLAQLIQTSHPDVIFAESVGSCADIVATVVKPLLELGAEGVKPDSFSVFSDARMLRRRLSEQEMPFSEDVVYIYDKQIEEAGLIIVNKIDLLSEAAREEVRGLLATRYPLKPYLMQTSLNQAGVQPWLERIQSGTLQLPADALEINYQRYGAGEAQLAWFDVEMALSFPENQGRSLLRLALRRILDELSARKAGIGHLKFILHGSGVWTEGNAVKISFPSLEEPGWEERIPEIHGTQAGLLVNARVEIPAETLRSLIETAMVESGIDLQTGGGMAFHPGEPKPTHRFA